MARPRDFLARFRPVGTPGSAAPAGVPADRVTELGVELGPLLDALADTQDQAAAIRSAGEADALRIRREGRTKAEDLVVAARTGAETERAGALARTHEEADSTVGRAVDAAIAEAAAIENRVAARLPEFVARVEVAVRAELFDSPVPATHDRPEGNR